MSDRVTASALLLATTLVVSVLAGAGAAATAGASSPDGAASTHAIDATPADPDAEIRNGSGYWVGQTLSTDAFDADATVELFRADGDSWLFVSDVRVNDSGVAVLGTSDLDVGEYELRSGGGDTLRFSLRTQQVAVTAEPGSVSTEPDVSPETTLRFESNRAEYELAVLTDQLTPAELEATLGVEGEPYDADGDGNASEPADGLVLTNRSFGTESTLVPNFSGRDTGSYELRFVATDTGAAATATVNVLHGDPRTAGFEEPLHTMRVNGTTTIDVEVPDAAVVTVSDDDGYAANVTLHDEDGDGVVTLRIDASASGEAVYSTTGADEVNVTVGGSGIDTGPHDLEVRVGTDPADPAQNVGTLDVQPADARTTTTADGATTATTAGGPTQSEDGTATTDSSTMDETANGTTATDATSGDDGGLPGFGPVVGLVAVVATALLARRAT